MKAKTVKVMVSVLMVWRILERFITIQRLAHSFVTLANLRYVGGSLDPVRQQVELILDWLTSDEGLQATRGIIQRYRLQVESDDLVHQAWIRISTSFTARQEPLESVQDSSDAARYGYRVLSNLALDQLRVERRRVDRENHVAEASIAPSFGLEEQVLGMVFFEEMVRRVVVYPSNPGNCGGCSPAVIRSIAIRVVQSIALESISFQFNDEERVRSRDWFDHLVESAIGRINGERNSARMRKRHSRCKACVRELLSNVMGQMEGRHG